MRRIGNKKELVPNILPLIPAHSTYIEPFFGTGAVFFAKPLAKKNLLNDIDKELYFFYKSIQDETTYSELKSLVSALLYHRSEIKQWYDADIPPSISAEYAMYYGIRAYFTYFNTFLFKNNEHNFKQLFLEKICEMREKITQNGVVFENLNAIDFFRNTSVRYPLQTHSNFIYLDPPYPNTKQLYGAPEFAWNDLQLLSDTIFCKFSRAKVMISLYLNENAEYFAKKNSLTIIPLKKAKCKINDPMTQTECVLVNYAPPILSIFN